MKKVILSAMVVMLSTAAFANNSKVVKLEDANKFSININVRSLGKYLNLSEVQAMATENISADFSSQMALSKYKKAGQKEASVKSAVYVNLKAMKEILSDKQYKMYLQTMNTTLKNRGLWNYVVASN